MLRKALPLIAFLVPIFANLGARADICFQYGSGGGVTVAKGVTLPAENACLPVSLVDRGVALGIGTGTICTGGDPPGTGVPSLVYQYTYTACVGPWFEAGTCRIELDVTGGFPRADLPPDQESAKGQKGNCNIFYASLDENGKVQFTHTIDASLRAWKCNIPTVAHGDASTCARTPAPFSHPAPPVGGVAK
jgi:hypothetical protein